MRRQPEARRTPGALLASLALHVVLGALVGWVLSIPLPLSVLFRRERSAPLPVERISFLAVPDRGTTVAGRSGGDGRPARPPAPSRPLVPPREIPTEPLAPAEPRAVPAPEEGGSGPLVGRGGRVPGITPSYHDPRIWAPPTDVVSAPKTPAERLDSALVSRIIRHNDSIAVANSGGKAGDLTWERNGKKYGIDSTGIHLGGITIPRKVGPLDLFPQLGRNTPLSPTQERMRAIALMNRDIQEQAHRSMTEDEFRAAVKRIRERKERERRQQQLTSGGSSSQTP